MKVTRTIKLNWKLTKVGDIFSVSFPTTQGDKRVPVEVASPDCQPILDGILSGEIKYGSFKLICHRHKQLPFGAVA